MTGAKDGQWAALTIMGSVIYPGIIALFFPSFMTESAMKAPKGCKPSLMYQVRGPVTSEMLAGPAEPAPIQVGYFRFGKVSGAEVSDNPSCHEEIRHFPCQ